MTKTLKLSAIFFITTLSLVLVRMLSTSLNLSDNISDWLFSFLVQVVSMGVIPIVLYKFWVKDNVVTGLYIKPKLPAKIYGITLIIALLFIFLTMGVSAIWQIIIRLLGFTPANNPSTIYSGPEVLILGIICTAVFPAIFEEITDRGLLMRLFDDVSDDRNKVIYMAVLFALAHQNILQSGYTFVGGLILAYLAVKTKSIVPGMIIHFLNNLSSVLISYSSQKNGSLSALSDRLYSFINNNFFLAILAWIAAGAVIVMLLRYIKESMRKNEPERLIPSEPENFYTYSPGGSNMQQLDDLFGFSSPINAVRSRPKWYEYAFLYASIALSVSTTVMTFLWGLWR